MCVGGHPNCRYVGPLVVGSRYFICPECLFPIEPR